MTSRYNDSRREGQRIHPKWEEFWPEFERSMKQRLRVGHQEYGDRSFSRPLFSLLGEVEQEIYDIIGWSFIALTRFSSLRERVQLMEDRLGEEEMNQILSGYQDRSGPPSPISDPDDQDDPFTDPTG